MNESSNKDILVSKAFEMFKNYGYDQTSISSIRKEAGVSNGTFYHYFKTKEDLLIAVCLQEMNIYDLKDNMEDKAADPEKHLTAYFLSWGKYFESLGVNIVSQVYRIFNTVFIDSASNEVHSIKKIWQTHQLEQFIEMAQKKGTLRTDYSAKEYSRLLFMLTRGILFEWILQPDKVDLEETAKRYLPIIINELYPSKFYSAQSPPDA